MPAGARNPLRVPERQASRFGLILLPRRSLRRRAARALVMGSFRLARAVRRLVAELRQLVVEGLDGGLALLQQIGDEGLLAALDRFSSARSFSTSSGRLWSGI